MVVVNSSDAYVAGLAGLLDLHWLLPGYQRDYCAPGGNLVFAGGTNDRKFHALDATSGKLLWEYPTSSGIIAPPSTFLVDGVQYVAVQSGWGVDSRSVQARLNAQFPGEYPEVPEGGSIWVFAVK